jgi:hypothetical protein
MDLRDDLPPDFDWPEAIRRLRERTGHRDNLYPSRQRPAVSKFEDGPIRQTERERGKVYSEGA